MFGFVNLLLLLCRLGASKPCLTYGLRGLAYFSVSVQCCEQDLHSGMLGGTVHEAMTDLVRLMSSLVESSGKILVPGIMDDVAPVTVDEEALYDGIDFDCEAYKRENKIVASKLMYDNKKDLLMGRWRYPTLSLHGIEVCNVFCNAITLLYSLFSHQ